MLCYKYGLSREAVPLMNKLTGIIRHVASCVYSIIPTALYL